MTFGNLEEHGPHIPIGSDYFQAVGVRDRLIDRLRAAHPDYDFVTVPVVPLGECGANHMARQFEHVGTFGVRYETLRDVAIDLGRSIAEKQFQNIFIIHFHGCPLHNAALSEAAAFVSDRYNVRMVNVTTAARVSLKGEFFNPSVLEKHLGKGWEERIGFEGHAGAAETSTNLFLHGLVKPEYKRLEPFRTKDVPGFFRTYERQGWRGYWGDPARATKDMGRDLLLDHVERARDVAEQALAGQQMADPSLPSLPEAEELTRIQLERYSAEKAEIDAWLKGRQGPKP
jgi:creatinine amidohydrolase/Fe(II)-dependent formamide hydrolase-like protein